MAANEKVYDFGNCTVRVIGVPNADRIRKATEAFMKNVTKRSIENEKK